MASEYYGLRGSLVKTYQQYLNELGAKLNVDGIWGPKTEAAYAKFMDEFQNKLYGNEDVEEEPIPQAEEYQFTPRTEEELRAMARETYAPVYDQQLEEAEKNAQRQTSNRQALIDALTPLYEEQLASLSKQYEKSRENLSNQALSRGLGRSSYLLDQMSGSQAQEHDAQMGLLKQKNDRQAALEAEISGLLSDLGSNRDRIAAQREQAILEAIEKGRQEDQQRQFEVLKYNNSLKQDARDYAQQVKQYEEELKLKKLKL